MALHTGRLFNFSGKGLSNMNTIAGFWRRFFALVYDALLVMAILFLASALATATVAVVFPGFQQQHPGELAHHPLYLLYLLACWYGYYAYSWRRGGQTLGMRAWRLKLGNQLSGTPNHWQLLARFISSACGLGLLAAIIHPRKASVQDIISNTYIVLLPRTPKQP